MNRVGGVRSGGGGGVDRLGPRPRLPPLSPSVRLVTCFGGREKCEGSDNERFKYGRQAQRKRRSIGTGVGKSKQI